MILNHNSHFLIGIFLVTLSFFCAALMNAFGKAVIEILPVEQILFFQNFFALILIFPVWLFNRQPLWHTKRIGLHLVRAFAGLLFYACFFISVKHISLLNATLLSNATPLFLPFIVWFWLGKKISIYLWASLIIGFLGVVFILHPSGDIFNSWMILVALLGSFFSAIALQSIRNLRTTESPYTIIFYYFLIGAIVTFPLLFFRWKSPSIEECIIVLLIGVMLFFTQLLLVQAYRYASPVKLGPFNYSIVIFAGLIGWIWWNQIPSFFDVIGIILVSLGVIISICYQDKKN